MIARFGFATVISLTKNTSEPFWLDISLANHMNAEIALADVSVSAAFKDGTVVHDPSVVEVQTLDVVIIPPMESTIVRHFNLSIYSPILPLIFRHPGLIIRYPSK